MPQVHPGAEYADLEAEPELNLALSTAVPHKGPYAPAPGPYYESPLPGLDPADGIHVEAQLILAKDMIERVVPAGEGLMGPPLPTPPGGPVEDPETADPWDSMTTHAALDAYVATESILTPVGWSTMTIAEKKAWLDANA